MSLHVRLAIVALALGFTGCRDSYHNWRASWDVAPDGRSFVLSADGRIGLYTVSSRSDLHIANGSDPIFVASPTLILYTGVDGALWLLDLAGKRSRRVTAPGSGETDEQPVFDANTKRVFFTVMTEPGPNGRFHAWDVWSCRLDGSDMTRCTSQGFWQLRMSPQGCAGGQLRFEEAGPAANGDLDSKEKLATMDLKPPYRMTYTPLPDEAGAPAIARERSEVAFSAGAPGEYYIQFYDLSGMRLLARGQDTGMIEHPLFTRAGAQVCYLKEEGAKLTAWSMDRSGARRKLFERDR